MLRSLVVEDAGFRECVSAVDAWVMAPEARIGKVGDGGVRVGFRLEMVVGKVPDLRRGVLTLGACVS